MFRSFGLLLFIATPTFAAPVPKDVMKTDEAKLAGTWEAVRISYSGRDAMVSKQAAIRWTLEPGGKASASNNPSGMAYRIYPESTPKGFDLHWSSTVLKGLYQIEGDTLKVVTNAGDADGTERPDALAPSANRYYWEFKRVKPEGK